MLGNHNTHKLERPVHYYTSGIKHPPCNPTLKGYAWSYHPENVTCEPCQAALVEQALLEANPRGIYVGQVRTDHNTGATDVWVDEQRGWVRMNG